MAGDFKSSRLEQKALVKDKSVAEELKFSLNLVAGEASCIFVFRVVENGAVEVVLE